jgi:hypothetical protein
LAGTMGLLDDAIREHMELKRLRGADPSVLARQEQDALGPVVRESEDEEQTFEDGGGGHEVALEDDGDGGHGIALEDGGHSRHEDLPGDGSGPSAAHPAGSDFANVGQETAELDMRTVLDEQHEVADRAGQIDSAGLGAKDGEEDPEPVEDVLEETPEFLRDTPEQERLWFEQQGPRDFDFDG